MARGLRKPANMDVVQRLGWSPDLPLCDSLLYDTQTPPEAYNDTHDNQPSVSIHRQHAAL